MNADERRLPKQPPAFAAGDLPVEKPRLAYVDGSEPRFGDVVKNRKKVFIGTVLGTVPELGQIHIAVIRPRLVGNGMIVVTEVETRKCVEFERLLPVVV